MLWLFGQIWLGLLTSFASGAAVTAYFFTRMYRARTWAEPEIAQVDDDTDYDTDYLENGFGDEVYDQEREPEYPPRANAEWPPDPAERTESGHREGLLPLMTWPPHQRGDDPIQDEEPDWPKADDVQQAETRPRRRG
jgi:hypothetical protein